jgi:tRNA (guanine-N7-)-methyltransferase
VSHLKDTTGASPETPESGAFYGRRKGKALRAGQERLVATVLPRLRVDPTDPLTGLETYDTRHLEIGFGGGEHLAAQARANPDTGFIGCEPFVNGMAKLLAVVEAESLANVRVWDDDVTKLLPRLPEAAFDRVVILYPDPWPKRRQRKRRLVSDDTLAALARILRPGGELRFASDIDDYIGWVLVRAQRSPEFRWTAQGPDDWRRPWDGWPGTRYETKAVREGRVPSYLTFERVAG